MTVSKPAFLVACVPVLCVPADADLPQKTALYVPADADPPKITELYVPADAVPPKNTALYVPADAYPPKNTADRSAHGLAEPALSEGFQSYVQGRFEQRGTHG